MADPVANTEQCWWMDPACPEGGTCCIVTIARHELHPINSPTHMCFGFAASCVANGKTKYIETLIPLASVEGLSDEDASQLAWLDVSVPLRTWFEEVSQQGKLVGSVFVPHVVDTVVEGAEGSEVEGGEGGEGAEIAP